MAEYEHQPIWYARREGQVRGPFTAEEVRRYLLLGRIREGDELSRDGMEWRPAADCPQVFPEELRDVRTAADRRRLNWARARVDERRGERRRGTQRLTPPVIERRGADRRRPEDSQLVWFRTFYQVFLDTRGPRWRYAGWFGAAAFLAVLFVTLP